MGPTAASGPTGPITFFDRRLNELEDKIKGVSVILDRLNHVEEELLKLRPCDQSSEALVHPYPLEGIEVIPRKDIVITESSPEPLSVADRLLLNSSALKALERDEAEGEDEVCVETSQGVEEEEEDEIVLEEADDEVEESVAAEEEELEEFEYKNSTYYRDPEKNVYMADEDGELIPTPIGVWSEVKKRIIIKKQDA